MASPPTREYPRITERHGENVQQYPEEEELSEEELAEGLKALEAGEDEE